MSTDDYDKFLDWNVREVIEFLEDNEQYGDDWSEQKKGLNDLLAEVKRFEQVKKWVYGHKKYPTITKIHLKDLIDVIEGEEE